jgi:hypothetical protein
MTAYREALAKYQAAIRSGTAEEMRAALEAWERTKRVSS